MFTFGTMFPFPGSHLSAVMVGALNAVNAPRERERWYSAFLAAVAARWGEVATRDACEAFELVRRRAKGCKRRQVKRAVVRYSRRERIMLKNLRGAHWRATQSR